MVVLYLGAPGCGKTTLMRRHVYDGGADVRAFLIVDHDGTWDGKEWSSPDELLASDTIPRFNVFRGSPGAAVARAAIALGDCVLVDDEIDGQLGDEKWKGSPLREIAKRGRHLPNATGEICTASALVATHRPANLHPDLRGLAARIYLGRLTAYSDAEACYREGWVPDARSALDAQRILAARGHDFTTWP